MNKFVDYNETDMIADASKQVNIICIYARRIMCSDIYSYICYLTTSTIHLLPWRHDMEMFFALMASCEFDFVYS